MSLGNIKPRVSRFRIWAGLCIWSVLVAVVYVILQAQDDVWAYGDDGTRARIRLTIGGILVLFFTFVFSYVVVRAWRNLPTRRATKFWLRLTSVFLGGVWVSLLCWLDAQHGSMTPLPLVLLGWIIWSLVFLTGLLFIYSLRHFFRWLFSWRILKRCLLALGLITALVALFYAEENWRGRRAWDECRRELEAKGEKLDFKAFIPPPMPDEQNFALAPIMATAYEARFDQNGQLEGGKYICLRSPLDMELGRTNYSFPTNVIIGSWENTRLTELGPWQSYFRATALTNIWGCEGGSTNIEITLLDTNEFPTSSRPQGPAADVLLALSRYEWVLQEVQKAAQRPASRFPLNYQAEYPSSILLMHLSRLKNCALVLQLRSVAELQQGQTKEALADVKLMLRLADSVHSEPILLSHLVRANFVNMALQPIWEGLAENRWSSAELKDLIDVLKQYDFPADWQFFTRGERMFVLGYIDYAKRHRDETAFWMMFAVCPRLFQSLDSCENWLPEIIKPFTDLFSLLSQLLPDRSIVPANFNLPPNGWYDQNKVEITRLFQEQILPISDPRKHLISQTASSNLVAWLNEKRKRENIRVKNVLTYQFLGSYDYISKSFSKTQNAVDMALLACALEWFHLTYGKYPATLSELTPEYLETIPPDVVNGEPLHYQRTANGSFKLYSIGWNGHDDGGVIGTNQYEYHRADTGDWVWQYPAKP